MSRSYRKTPIVGNTKATSDKPFKRASNKKLRTKLRDIIADGDPDKIDEESNLDVKSISNIYNSEKDGKHYCSEQDATSLDWYHELYNLPIKDDNHYKKKYKSK